MQIALGTPYMAEGRGFQNRGTQEDKGVQRDRHIQRDRADQKGVRSRGRLGARPSFHGLSHKTFVVVV